MYIICVCGGGGGVGGFREKQGGSRRNGVS